MLMASNQGVRMNGLEQAFYIISIIFMSLLFLMLIALVVAVFVIRAKINKIHDTIEHHINSITSLAERGGELSALAGTKVIKKAKKVLKKAKR